MDIEKTLIKILNEHYIINVDLAAFSKTEDSKYILSAEGVSRTYLNLACAVEKEFKKVLKYIGKRNFQSNVSSLLDNENVNFIRNINLSEPSVYIPLITKELRNCDIVYSSLFVESGAYFRRFGGTRHLCNKLEKLQLKNQKNKSVFFQNAERNNPYSTYPAILFSSKGFHFAGTLGGELVDLYFKLENGFFSECSSQDIYSGADAGSTAFRREFP